MYVCLFSEESGNTHTHLNTMSKLLHPLLTRGVIIYVYFTPDIIITPKALRYVVVPWHVPREPVSMKNFIRYGHLLFVEYVCS